MKDHILFFYCVPTESVALFVDGDVGQPERANFKLRFCSVGKLGHYIIVQSYSILFLRNTSWLANGKWKMNQIPRDCRIIQTVDGILHVIDTSSRCVLRCGSRCKRNRDVGICVALNQQKPPSVVIVHCV